LRTGSFLSGFGRAATVNAGAFRFTIRFPAASVDSGMQSAPHLELMIFARGLLKPLVTRIYFDGDAHNGRDAVLMSVPVARRATLLARKKVDVNSETWDFDVHLQGNDETVFFEF
jgi:protocatechuate 3,4-dioxygenase alpha subunit